MIYFTILFFFLLSNISGLILQLRRLDQGLSKHTSMKNILFDASILDFEEINHLVDGFPIYWII